MGCCLVRGDAQNDGIQFQEFAVQVTESLGLLGSPGCIVFGVEIKHNVFPLKILQCLYVAVCIRQTECRCRLSFLYAHGILPSNFHSIIPTEIF